ncbi:MAG: PEGA domain-containing protein [Candidatus Omnitrophica bacterium]|nr:PEGA domain-containing protein [Candidatus Omnitrophota bacterium]
MKLALSLLAAAILSAGCIARTLYVKSSPPGAAITVNHELKGTTPLTLPFDYYGTYRLRFELEGYEPLEVKEKIKGPWYDWFPIDLVTEILPLDLKVERSLTYNLAEKKTLEP